MLYINKCNMPLTYSGTLNELIHDLMLLNKYTNNTQ